jgi:hypothetical protein
LFEAIFYSLTKIKIGTKMSGILIMVFELILIFIFAEKFMNLIKRPFKNFSLELVDSATKTKNIGMVILYSIYWVPLLIEVILLIVIAIVIAIVMFANGTGNEMLATIKMIKTAVLSEPSCAWYVVIYYFSNFLLTFCLCVLLTKVLVLKKYAVIKPPSKLNIKV